MRREILDRVIVEHDIHKISCLSFFSWVITRKVEYKLFNFFYENFTKHTILMNLLCIQTSVKNKHIE